jgi:addiction module HigA family antidote
MSKSSTTTDAPTKPGKAWRVHPPIHPGEMLREEFLVPLGMTPYALARRLNVPRTRVERLVREETGLTPDTALRLARFFGSTPEFWLNMQLRYDLARAENESAKALAEIQPLRADAA